MKCRKKKFRTVQYVKNLDGDDDDDDDSDDLSGMDMSMLQRYALYTFQAQ